MTDRNRDQADLLDGFMETLSSGQTTPPDDLDPALAAVAVTLAAELTPPDPSARFISRLDQQLTATPAGANNRHATLPPSTGSELAVTQTDSGWSVSENPRRSRLAEFARLAAATLAVMLIGSVLIFMFSERDDDNGNVAGPGPSAGGPDEILVSWDPAGGENYKVYIVPTDGSEPRKLTPGPHEDDGITERLANWSPDGRYIAYLREEGGTSDIYIVDAEPGSEPVNITRSPDPEYTLAWSPDGQKIAFNSSRDGLATNIFIMDADGSDVQRLTSFSNGAVHPSWSPDGERITFARTPAGENATLQVWVMNADADNPEPEALTDLDALVEGQSWSPDGNHIVFWAASQLWIMSPDGAGLRSFTDVTGAFSTPVWSDDTLEVLYISGNVVDGASGIAIANPDGTIIRHWFPNADILATPSWSADSQRVAYLAGTDQNAGQGAFWDFVWELRISMSDGTGEITLVTGGLDIQSPPAWRPLVDETVPPLDSTPVPQTDTTPVAETAETPTILDSATPAWHPTGRLVSIEGTQRGEFANECFWQGRDYCVDSQTLTFPKEILPVPRGSEMIFSIDSYDTATLLNLRIHAFSLDDRDDIEQRNGKPILLEAWDSPYSLPFLVTPTGLAMSADLDPGYYALRIDFALPAESQSAATNGSATFGFHIQVAESEPEPPLKSFPFANTPFPDAEVVHVVSEEHQENGEIWETHTWIDQTSGDVIVQRYGDEGTILSIQIRRGLTFRQYTASAITTSEFLSEEHPTLQSMTDHLFQYRNGLRDGSIEILGEEVYADQQALKVTFPGDFDRDGWTPVAYLDPETLFPIGFDGFGGSPRLITYPVVETLSLDAMPVDLFDMEFPEAPYDFRSWELTNEQAAQFQEYPVWWLGDVWGDYTLQNITHSINTLPEPGADLVILEYTGTQEGQEIQIASHGELEDWEREAWQEAANYGPEQVSIGAFTGWLFSIAPTGSARLDLEQGGNHLRIHAPDRDTAFAVVEALNEINQGQ